jgi:hypothetical protein
MKEIGREILEADGRRIGGAGAMGDRRGEIGLPVRPDLERRAEVDFLGHAVDQPARSRVGQHEVEEADRRGGGA